MYDYFWLQVAIEPNGYRLGRVRVRHISKEFPMIRKTVYRWFVPLLFLPVSVLQAQTLTDKIVELPGFAFKYSTQTSASKATIWRLWTDVENWKQFDVALEYAYLQDGTVFAEGAQGYLKADGAPRVGFEIEQLKQGESFTVNLRIPLYQAIKQQRYFEITETGSTLFTHEVKFSGGLSPLVYLFLQSIYKRETQSVVQRLKNLAEAQ